MYAIAIMLTFFGISFVIAYLGYKLRKNYAIMMAFFFCISFYFIILGLGALLLIIAENSNGEIATNLSSLVETTYTILQTIFVWVILPLFLLGIIFDLIKGLYKLFSKKGRKRRWIKK